MFGLEKKPENVFEFDLEKDLKRDKNFKSELLKSVDERSAELKKILKEGSASSDFEQCGMLLHAYASLKKVINNVAK